MKKYTEMSREELLALKETLSRQYAETKAKGLSLDMINDFSKASDDLKTIEEIGTTINKEAAMRNYKDSNSKGK